MAEANTILIVEDQESLRLWLIEVLGKEGFRIISSATGDEALRTIYDQMPNLIILDLTLSPNAGYLLCKKLKQDFMLRHIPVLMLTERKDIREDTLGIEFGADDYVLKPVEQTDLLTRIRMALEHTYLELDINPLTRLPGNNSIIKRIEEILNKNTIFAICYVDLDNFKCFNDKYGFNRGDDIIRFTSGLITKVVKETGGVDDFIGHTGSDDFVIITWPERVDKICSRIIEEFDSAMPQFYDQEARRQGYIIKSDRRNRSIKVPIMSISIAVITNQERQFFHIGQINKLATELKDYVKSVSGSIYFQDRRQERISIIPGSLQRESILRYERMQLGARKRVDERIKKIDALKEIIQKEQIHILFQPIINFSPKVIIGYEALMRGPENTEMESPDVLFDLARESNMLWQLDRLCRKKILLFARDFNKMDSRLFLNTTPESIYDPEFRPVEALEGCHLKPENLVIELTERGIVKDFDKFYVIVKTIQEHKIKIAIDDAGSGYVSLRNVAKLKPDYIKIDISVIRNIDVDRVRQDVLSTWFSFAQRIGSELIAEGIQTKEEYDFIVSMGVSLGQGYLFARPGKPYPKLNRNI